MIIVSGLNRKTGQVRTQNFMPGREGNARQFRAHMRGLGYTTTFVNVVKDEYAMRDAFKKQDAEQPFTFEGIAQYQLHSLGTRTGLHKSKHIEGTNFLEDAVETAEIRVNGWSDSHKGIVIYRALKLVRRVTKPATEIVELS